jgi:sec-independent protein translocase protein TatB
MFDVGWSEFLIIIVVLLIVVGPKDLPRVVRAFGQWTGKARGYARDFQRTIEEAVDANEMAAVRKEIEMANRELAEISRTQVDLDTKLDLEEGGKKDPQAAQFAAPSAAPAPAPADPATTPAALQAQAQSAPAASPPSAANEPPARTA